MLVAFIFSLSFPKQTGLEHKMVPTFEIALSVPSKVFSGAQTQMTYRPTNNVATGMIRRANGSTSVHKMLPPLAKLSSRRRLFPRGRRASYKPTSRSRRQTRISCIGWIGPLPLLSAIQDIARAKHPLARGVSMQHPKSSNIVFYLEGACFYFLLELSYSVRDFTTL